VSPTTTGREIRHAGPLVRRRGQLADAHTHRRGPHVGGVAEWWIERPRCEHLYREESPGGIDLAPSSTALVTG